LIVPLRSALNTTGYFYYAWIIPYGIAVALLAIFLTPFLCRVGGKMVAWLGLSAATFLSGAVGLEMVSGRYLENVSEQKNLFYAFIVTGEESLEVVGLIMLIYASLTYLRDEAGVLIISLAEPEQD